MRLIPEKEFMCVMDILLRSIPALIQMAESEYSKISIIEQNEALSAELKIAA
jgi:hypothetical protein